MMKMRAALTPKRRANGTAIGNLQ